MPRKRSTRTQASHDDDDWHHISDQTLRKRIQNRVAQRKHRRIVGEKLKILEQLTGQQEFQDEINLWSYPTELTTNGPFSCASGPSSDGVSDTFMSATLDDVDLNMAADTASLSRQPSAHMVQTCDGSILRRPDAMPWSASSDQEVSRSSKPSNSASLPFTEQSLLYAPTAAKGTPPSYHSNSSSNTAGSSRCMLSQKQPADYFNTPLSTIFDFHFGRDSNGSSRDSRDGSLTEDRLSDSDAPQINNQDSRKPKNTNESSKCLATQIEKAIESIRELGFDSVDELAIQYYTADFQHRPALQHRRQLSRRRGLVDLLRSIEEDSREKWTEWEVQRYRDEILRSAEEVLEEEFSQFVKLYGSGKNKERSLAEQRRRFQEKLPNLSSLLNMLGVSVQPQGNGDRTAATVCAISVLLDSLDARSPNE